MDEALDGVQIVSHAVQFVDYISGSMVEVQVHVLYLVMYKGLA